MMVTRRKARPCSGPSFRCVNSAAEHNAAVTVRLKSEHRLGQVLRATVNHKGGGPPRLTSVTHGHTDLPPEITRKQSSRAQKVAEVPWEIITDVVAGQSEKDRETRDLLAAEMRWTEVLIGELLGPAEQTQGQRTDLSPASDKLPAEPKHGQPDRVIPAGLPASFRGFCGGKMLVSPTPQRGGTS
jgi:hypothetical protein